MTKKHRTTCMDIIKYHFTLKAGVSSSRPISLALIYSPQEHKEQWNMATANALGSYV